MSYSSLYGITKDYMAESIYDYQNSWIFAPIVWDVLSEKYIPKEIETPFGYKKSIIGADGNEIAKKLNEKMNKSGNTSDRICWEMSMQNIFFTKDKECIAKSIRNFVEQNKGYKKSEDDGISALEREHIIERFEEIARNISELDAEEYPYFVFKNTSVDDGVEDWFYKYDEETEDYKESPLSELDEDVAEFVVIEDGKIKEFIINTKFEY